MTKTHETPDTPRKPDGVLTTQKGNLTLITEVFFNHDSKATFPVYPTVIHTPAEIICLSRHSLKKV